jgi:hypothetical protein
VTVGKLAVLRLDDPVLARWLTSDPQHFNSRNDIAVRCLLDPLSPVSPWATVPEGVYVTIWWYARPYRLHRRPHSRRS